MYSISTPMKATKPLSVINSLTGLTSREQWKAKLDEQPAVRDALILERMEQVTFVAHKIHRRVSKFHRIRPANPG